MILYNCNTSQKESSQLEDTIIINDNTHKDTIIGIDTAAIKKDSLPSKKKNNEGIGSIKGGNSENGAGSSSNPRYASEPGRELTTQQRKEEYLRQIEERRKGITEKKESKPKDYDSGTLSKFKN